MKLSKLSFALILIGSALLLKGIVEENKKSKPRQKRNSHEEARDNYDNPPGQSLNHRRPINSATIEPPAHEQEWLEEQKRFWERQICISKVLNWITGIGAFAGAVGLVIVWWTLDVTQKNFVVAQRAHVTLSNKEGKVASFQNRNGSPLIELYFFNSGSSPALNFIVAARHSLRKGTLGYSPQNRWTSKSQGGIHMQGHLGASTITSEGSHIHSLQDISKEQLAQIRTGKDLFVIEGFFHYCDIFGRFRSERFHIHYRPPPIDEFVARITPKERPISQMSYPPPAELKERVNDLIPLPRCQQPEEEETH